LLSGQSLLSDEDKHLGEVFIAGTAGGALSTLVTTPLELIKCNLQVDKSKAEPGKIMRLVRARWHSGGFPALYTGFQVTLLRDSPASGLYFVVYEGSKDIFQEKLGFSHDTSSLLAGGFSGTACWTPIIPLDVIKSKLQTDCVRPESERIYKNFVHCFQKTFASEGIRGLYRGAGPLLIRAFPVNAVTFWVYEFLMRNVGGG